MDKIHLATGAGLLPSTVGLRISVSPLAVPHAMITEIILGAAKTATATDFIPHSRDEHVMEI